MFSFSYYQGNKERIILSYKDFNKWVFYQNGEILPFEEENFYRKRRIKDRLPNELIIKYLQRCGWDINDTDFWQTKKQVINFKKIK